MLPQNTIFCLLQMKAVITYGHETATTQNSHQVYHNGTRGFDLALYELWRTEGWVTTEYPLGRESPNHRRLCCNSRNGHQKPGTRTRSEKPTH